MDKNKGDGCAVMHNISLDKFQRIPLLKLSFTMKFHIHDGKHTNYISGKNTLMVLLYSSLANSSGSSSLTAAIISSI